ncbi:TKL/DICTY4/DRK protein kinase [Salpingoeca rosetta]|uniref:guanylate cyclase n=1 Tax=Salpingoeca rosetta (strain ATCC 50818 / BSB-021) TaxID=946362 RepID=F2UDV5_SALR5|nr:TKL/DICTY4/DRK protein kinase [Salpingoeca rosetta]EGD74805.1 TKL/DICTY4/DRK protein kinase [Salpingoeca rosetta]|eukprot:XP_004992450.1 TKL/DICTY4/DRK protein kinase [Salpingoeca rosetta]
MIAQSSWTPVVLVVALAAICCHVVRGAERKEVYTVGVLNNKGVDYFEEHFKEGFSTYLTNTAGRTFNPPVTFNAIPVAFSDFVNSVSKGELDFTYCNPTLFSCIESGEEMAPLLTVRNFRLGHELTVFAGVIFTAASRDDINTLEDVRGKRLSGVSMTSLGGFQMQYGMLHVAGIELMTDFAMVAFSSNHRQTVHDVLEGAADIGFVRTDTIEGMIASGAIEADSLKVLNARESLTPEGTKFPFVHSTPLYPEWPFGAHPSVDWQVQEAVMKALQSLNASSPTSVQGQYAEWQPGFSYISLRNLQEELGLLEETSTGRFECRQGEDLYSSLVCPVGFVLKSREEFDTACEEAGIACPTEDHSCFCSPCKPACPHHSSLVNGRCTCGSGYVRFAGGCERLSTALAATVVPVLVVLVAGVYLLIQYLHRRSDNLWHINPVELKFEDPPECLGSGSFGIVLKAEYRGTMVAVKRVLPPMTRRKVRVRADEEHLTLLEQLELRQKEKKSIGEQMEQYFQEAAYAAGMLVGGANGESNHSSIGGSLASGRSGASGSKSSRKSLRSKGSSGLRRRKQLLELKRSFMKEMRTLSKLRHPCVTTFIGGVVESSCDPMIVMEFMDLGSLYSILHNETTEVDGDVRYELLIDIISGCRFLHAAEPPIVHGDLKSMNVLVDAKFRAKVSDFGLSQGGSSKGVCGTPYWMAPELFKGAKNTKASDVYSFAIIMAEVFSRQDPYPAMEDMDKVLREVVRRKRRPSIPRAMPAELSIIMKESWHHDPDRRPSFNELSRRMGHVDASVCRIAVEKVTPKKRTGGNSVLEEVFPPHIAEALRQGKKIEPEHHELVTIFFSDIVGFTNISGTLPPEKVMNMLDRFYTKLDKLADEMELFKVETIGDAYMAVTNLLKEQSDHTARIARFAAAAIQAANATVIDPSDPSMGNVNIRVGFHAGPVVANVVGTKNPRYCLFGDTVNTASRMESTSEKNRIHLSDIAANLLRKQAPDMPLEQREKITVKGKGKMQTFWLLPPGPAPMAPALPSHAVYPLHLQQSTPLTQFATSTMNKKTPRPSDMSITPLPQQEAHVSLDDTRHVAPSPQQQQQHVEHEQGDGELLYSPTSAGVGDASHTTAAPAIAVARTPIVLSAGIDDAAAKVKAKAKKTVNFSHITEERRISMFSEASTEDNTSTSRTNTDTDSELDDDEDAIDTTRRAAGHHLMRPDGSTAHPHSLAHTHAEPNLKQRQRVQEDQHGHWQQQENRQQGQRGQQETHLHGQVNGGGEAQRGDGSASSAPNVLSLVSHLVHQRAHRRVRPGTPPSPALLKPPATDGIGGTDSSDVNSRRPMLSLPGTPSAMDAFDL